MNTLKDYITIHLQLDVSEVVIHLMNYRIRYVFQKPTEDLNLSMFNMIMGINELETLIKHASYECKSKFDGRKCYSYQKWNNDKWQCECKSLREYNV